jgi:hypothetical protein
MSKAATIRASAPYATISLRDALADPLLLGNVLVGESWTTWRSLLLASMGERLTAVTLGPALFTSADLAAELVRLNCRTPIVDVSGILKDTMTMLALSAAGHVNSGLVDSCAGVLQKSYPPLGFLQGSGAQDDDPLRQSFLAGVAAGLDAGRAAA